MGTEDIEKLVVFSRNGVMVANGRTLYEWELLQKCQGAGNNEEERE